LELWRLLLWNARKKSLCRLLDAVCIKATDMARTALSERRKRSGRLAALVARCLVISSMVVATGCDFPGRPNPKDRPVPADQVLSFSALYGQNCAGCHGAEGKLGAAPPLNDGLFRVVVSKDELESIITDGRHTTLMPAFAKEKGGSLTATQIQVIVHEIKGIPYKIVPKQEDELSSAQVVADASGIAPAWGSITEEPADTPAYRHQIVAADESGSRSAAQGARTFARACAICHGGNGEGVAKGSKMRRKINDPVTLKLMSDQLLRRYVITGRPDLGMPNFAAPRPGDTDFEPLTDRDVADIVALLASWRHEPGKTSDFARD
jgi:mono/diheme cytochrome c family protein